MVPEHGLASLSILPNVAVQPARRNRTRKLVQRRGSTLPEKPKEPEDDERCEESGEPEKRSPEHPGQVQSYRVGVGSRTQRNQKPRTGLLKWGEKVLGPGSTVLI